MRNAVFHFLCRNGVISAKPTLRKVERKAFRRGDDQTENPGVLRRRCRMLRRSYLSLRPCNHEVLEEVLKHELHKVQRAVLKASKPSSTLCTEDSRSLVLALSNENAPRRGTSTSTRNAKDNAEVRLRRTAQSRSCEPSIAPLLGARMVFNTMSGLRPAQHLRCFTTSYF